MLLFSMDNALPVIWKDSYGADGALRGVPCTPWPLPRGLAQPRSPRVGQGCHPGGQSCLHRPPWPEGIGKPRGHAADGNTRISATPRSCGHRELRAAAPPAPVPAGEGEFTLPIAQDKQMNTQQDLKRELVANEPG